MAPVIRPFVKADGESTSRIFFDAVCIGAASHYSDSQRRAWAPRLPETEAWLARLEPQTVWVGELGGEVVGFMTLRDDGCIDLAFVAPARMGTGVGGALYDVIEEAARRKGLTRLHSEASLLARSFFQKRGWKVIKQQTVQRDQIELPNFLMEKRLGEPS